MITIKVKSTIANISELRKKETSDQLLKNLKDHNVVLEKHHSPVAVMIDFNQFAVIEKMVEFAEDYVLGMLAQERDKSSKEKFVDIDKW